MLNSAVNDQYLTAIRVPDGRRNTTDVVYAPPTGGWLNLALLYWLLGGRLKVERTAVLQTIWVLGLTAVALYAARQLRATADPVILAWLIYLAGVLLILYKPRYAIYLILFLGLVGDGILIPWYPFVKNFSSSESIFHLNDSLIVNPLESYIVLAFVSWLGRAVGTREFRFYKGPIFWPLLLFMLFASFGLVWGLGRGGDTVIGLFEARPLFYLPVMLILVSNLISKREHINVMIWAIILALFIESVAGMYFVLVVLGGSLRSVEAITEHAAAVHMNTMFILAAAVWVYKGSAAKRIILPLIVPIILVSYVANQRRAAFLALAIALLLLFFVMYRERRYAFWFIVPPLLVLGVVYLATYWNAGGAIGKPAQAVKSVIAPNQLHIRDQLSNVYRVLENVNVRQTIKSAPLTGYGFGHKFLIVVPMPDISFFKYWEYLPHNSILWVWIKMGIGGFFSLIYLIGTAVMTSVRTWWRMPNNDLKAISFTMSIYLIMHFIYAYVDISWDIQSMLYVGTALGLANSMERIVGQAVPAPRRRWHWQKEPAPAPGLEPVE
jgi:hypothetical protein